LVAPSEGWIRLLASLSLRARTTISSTPAGAVCAIALSGRQAKAAAPRRPRRTLCNAEYPLAPGM